MKNVYEVLRQKELELARLEKEVEALRVAAPLLSDDKESMLEATSNKPTLTSPTTTQQPIRIPQAAVNASPQPARAAVGKTQPSAGHKVGDGVLCSVRGIKVLSS
jgi:hypothetical protein